MIYPNEAFVRRSGSSTEPRTEDPRGPFARDRDRLLYSSAFRSLAGKSQVVASTELTLFHTRLTHSLKVAQLGRRLAEQIRQLNDSRSQFRQSSPQIVRAPDPDLVEFACLAHDLGHPPFGHAGESALHKVVDDLVLEAVEACFDDIDDDTLKGLVDKARLCIGGFEGNPQTFRIITRLSHKAPPEDSNRSASDTYLGLDLTAASIDAVSKYPWCREKIDSRKWGAYGDVNDEESDMATLLNARRTLNCGDPIHGPNARKSFECELMEWCDDVTYAVHDVEDFHMIGMIPLERIFDHKQIFESKLSSKPKEVPVGDRVSESMTNEWKIFRDYIREKWGKDDNKDYYGRSRPTCGTYLDSLRDELIRFGMVGLDAPQGSILALRMSQRRSSNLIKHFASTNVGFRDDAPLLHQGTLRIANCAERTEKDCIEESCEGEACIGAERRLRHKCDMLKELIWKYVIESTSMKRQQAGQSRIITELVRMCVNDERMLPPDYQELAATGKGVGYTKFEFDVPMERIENLSKELLKIRVVADYISSLTEQQAHALHGQLTGAELGHLQDFVSR